MFVCLYNTLVKSFEEGIWLLHASIFAYYGFALARDLVLTGFSDGAACPSSLETPSLRSAEHGPRLCHKPHKLWSLQRWLKAVTKLPPVPGATRQGATTFNGALCFDGEKGIVNSQQVGPV